MPRPKKIHKKKSFMFTTKHHSENGIISLVLGAVSLIVFIASVVMSFRNRGEVIPRLGGVGLFAMLGDIVGAVAGTIGLGERDIFKWGPWAGIISNAVMFIVWALILISGVRGA